MSVAEVEDLVVAAEQPLLEIVPVIVLQQHILARTNALTMCNVAVCNKYLYTIATADALWQQLCEQRGWGPFAKGTTWYQGFCVEYSKLCVECSRPTRYIFKLTGCRLCEKCEFEHPKYGLVTTAEATERYNLTLAQLATLDFVPFQITRLYLRSSVVRIAAAGIAGMQLAGRGRLPSSAGAPYGSSAESDEEQEEEEGGRGASSEDEGETERGASQVSADEAAARRAAEKAARKARKKQVKAEQRHKRQLKAAGERSGGQSPLFGSSPPSASPSSWPGPQRNRTPSQGGSAPPGRGFTPGSSPPGPRGSSFMAGSSPPSGSFMPGTSPSGRKSRGPRQRNPRPAKVWSEDGTHVVSGKKAVSSWLAERQQLMAEWGEYALSGLVLAS